MRALLGEVCNLHTELPLPLRRAALTSQAAGRAPALRSSPPNRDAGTFPAHSLPLTHVLLHRLPFLGEKTAKATIQSCFFSERNNSSHLAILKEGGEIAGLGAPTKEGAHTLNGQ